MITFRPGPSFIGLDDAMKEKKEFETTEDFLTFLNDEYDCVREEMGFSFYDKWDERIGWKNVFLVVLRNIPYGFVTFDEVKGGTMFNSKGDEI